MLQTPTGHKLMSWAVPNEVLNLTAAAFLVRAVRRPCSGRGKLAQTLSPAGSHALAVLVPGSLSSHGIGQSMPPNRLRFFGLEGQ